MTARLVNPEGLPITSDEEKEESVDAIPLPEIASPLPDVGGGKSYRPFEKDYRPVSMPRSYRSIQTSMPETRGSALNPAARRIER